MGTTEEQPAGQQHYDEKHGNVQANHGNALDSDAEQLTNEDAQYGVKAIEATAITWSKKSLIAAYAAIFVVYFVNSLLQQTSFQFGPYVTSAFFQHSLLPTTGVMSSIISGVIRLPLAKVMDIVGRTEGYLVAVSCATVGLIMMAACNSVSVYAAAQVFYWVGYLCMDYCLDVFIADTSSLKNRGLMYAFATTPYIVTTFAGPEVGARFLGLQMVDGLPVLTGPGWRWGYGSFAIITPAICAPVAIIFWLNRRKAIQTGLLRRQESGRTFAQSVKFYFFEFDVIGLVLITAGFAMFLLPFNLAAASRNRWQSADIITLIIMGGLCLIAFGVYERFWAPKPFIPYHLLKDRTVLGSCILAATLFVSFYCWDGYFLSYLQVVWGLSVRDAGYVNNTYNIGSCAWAIVAGLAIRRWGRIKYFALAALPVMFLGAGLLIHFRQPDQKIGYVVMAQVFIAVSGGTLVICEQIAIMAAGSHENVATLLALIGMFSSIGGAVGSSISAAIWTNVLPNELAKRLPDELKSQAPILYAAITDQLAYPRGTPEREAIIGAYAVAQYYMAIAATCVLVVALGAVLMWKNIDVRTFKQVKGRVI